MPYGRAPRKRSVESLTQSREVRRDTSGSSDLPEGENWRGKEHVGKAGVTRRDNLPNSLDSRHWKHSAVSKDYIYGKVTAVKDKDTANIRFL